MNKTYLAKNKKLGVPIIVENLEEKINTIEDTVAIRSSFAIAYNKKFNKKKEKTMAEEKDAQWEQILKIPDNSSDLIVTTKAKKLGAYIMAITAKSPAKFRGVYVNRMQNYCLDILENMLNANYIRQDGIENKRRRDNYQTDAIIKLKILGYVAMLAENVGCILTRQYKQISLQIGETVNLAVAWRKSDEEKWINK